MLTDKDSWSTFLPYQSASFSQIFLRRIYETRKMDEPVNKSYQNGYSFTYYLIHGQRFFEQAALSPYEIKPLLLFYGLVQLCKACLLTMDEDYPKNSTVLAHGVSTRKLKKQGFDFLQDTVLIQKKGLFAHMASTIFGMEALDGQKYQMENLFQFVPEMQDIYLKLKGRPFCRPVEVDPEGLLHVDRKILDDLKMTDERFFRFFKHDFEPYKEQKNVPNKLTFILKRGSRIDDLFLQNTRQELFLSSHRENYPLMPELLVHYLILYNLSMISRYETEWWNDLFLQRSSQDISFIQAFIDQTEKKIPIIVSHFLERYLTNL